MGNGAGDNSAGVKTLNVHFLSFKNTQGRLKKGVNEEYLLQNCVDFGSNMDWDMEKVSVDSNRRTIMHKSQHQPTSLASSKSSPLNCGSIDMWRPAL